MRADFSERPEAIRRFADAFLAVHQQRPLEQRECWAVAGPDGLAYVDPKRQRARLGSVSRVSYRRDAAAGSPRTPATASAAHHSQPASPSHIS